VCENTSVAFRNPATRSSSSSGSSLQRPGRRHCGPELSTSKRSLVSALEVVPAVTAVAMQVTVDHEPSLACLCRGGVGYRCRVRGCVPCHGGVYGMRVPAGVLLASDCNRTASPVLLCACTPLTITRGVLWQRSQCKVDGVRCIDHCSRNLHFDVSVVTDAGSFRSTVVLCRSLLAHAALSDFSDEELAFLCFMRSTCPLEYKVQLSMPWHVVMGLLSHGAVGTKLREHGGSLHENRAISRAFATIAEHNKGSWSSERATFEAGSLVWTLPRVASPACVNDSSTVEDAGSDEEAACTLTLSEHLAGTTVRRAACLKSHKQFHAAEAMLTTKIVDGRRRRVMVDGAYVKKVPRHLLSLLTNDYCRVTLGVPAVQMVHGKTDSDEQMYLHTSKRERKNGRVLPSIESGPHDTGVSVWEYAARLVVGRAYGNGAGQTFRSLCADSLTASELRLLFSYRVVRQVSDVNLVPVVRSNVKYLCGLLGDVAQEAAHVQQEMNDIGHTAHIAFVDGG
jgi:hypothetical protein